MRIGGIASGMDTEQMIYDLMKVERMRVDRLFQQEQRLKWRQEAYNNVNKTMANFILDSRKAFGLTTVSNTGTMLSNSVNSLKWVKKATSSNESAIKVTANANAMEGTHKVKVEQLAEVARVSSEKLTKTEGLEGSFTIETKYGKKEIILENTKVSGEDITKLDFSGDDNGLTFAINGKVITLDGQYDSENDLRDAINEKLGANSDVRVDIKDGKLVFESEGYIHITESAQGDLASIGLKEGTTRANNTIDYLVKEINNAVATDESGKPILDKDGKTISLGLRAAFDKDLQQLMISTKDMGADEFIQINTTIKDNDGFSLLKFNARSKDTGEIIPVTNGEKVEGVSAKIIFNGETVEKTSNNFSIYGMNLQLQEVDPTKEININISSDVDSIFDQVKSFVDEYNKIIDDINGQLGQKYYRDYNPLSNEEKAAMNEKDVELWEEKAKSGLIRNDSTLTRILQNMRSSLYEKVEGVSGDYNHITQIGIATGNYQDGGKLVINEEKLRAAINNDPDGVMELLFKVPESSVADGEKAKNTGLVQRIYDNMIDGMKDIISKSGPGDDATLLRNVRSNILIDFVTNQSSISLLDKDLSNINKRIAREESILIKREDSYWQRFTAMEKAMASMQQQSMWLMSQMGLQ